MLQTRRNLLKAMVQLEDEGHPVLDAASDLKQYREYALALYLNVDKFLIQRLDQERF